MKNVRMYTVMAASPSDIPQARQTLKEAIHAWNSANTFHRNIILLPLLWEHDSVPLLGDGDGQDVINQQLVNRADIIFALFGSRLGQPTSKALSGTVAEMQKAHDAGRPVHPFFYKGDIPQDADLEQLQKLRDFKKNLGGLYADFVNNQELTTMVWQAIESDLARLEVSLEDQTISGSSNSKGVDFLIQPASERYADTDSRGRLKYKTRRWVEITNRGDTDAYDVVVEPMENQHFWVQWNGPIDIQHGQTRKAILHYTMATSRAEIIIRWTEDGEEKSMQAQLD